MPETKEKRPREVKFLLQDVEVRRAARGRANQRKTTQIREGRGKARMDGRTGLLNDRSETGEGGRIISAVAPKPDGLSRQQLGGFETATRKGRSIRAKRGGRDLSKKESLPFLRGMQKRAGGRSGGEDWKISESVNPKVSTFEEGHEKMKRLEAGEVPSAPVVTEV